MKSEHGKREGLVPQARTKGERLKEGRATLLRLKPTQKKEKTRLDRTYKKNLKRKTLGGKEQRVPSEKTPSSPTEN